MKYSNRTSPNAVRLQEPAPVAVRTATVAGQEVKVRVFARGASSVSDAEWTNWTRTLDSARIQLQSILNAGMGYHNPISADADAEIGDELK